MSTQNVNAPIHGEVLDGRAHDVDESQLNEGLDGEEQGSEHATSGSKRKREKKEPVVLVRDEGKSLLPFSRVQKIIKADKDIPIIAKDATFLISLATEEFIKRLTEAAQHVANREKRATVQHKDIATVVRKADEFLFLEEIVPWLASDAAGPPKRKSKAADEGVKGTPTMLDQFVVSTKGGERGGEHGGEIVFNEDGTMIAAGGELDDYSE